MRYILLVAQREFAENVKTKGFWIGILLFPVLLFASFKVQVLLEEATPTRRFVLVDRSGEFEDVVTRSLERLHMEDVRRALESYAKKYAKEPPAAGKGPGGIDLESVPAQFVEDMQRFLEDNSEAVDELMRDGLDAVIAQLRPSLREDAPEFVEPKRRFERVPMPEGISADAEVATLAEELKPYLTGSRKLEVGGERSELFAAILVPADVEEHVVRPGKLTVPAMSGRRGVQYWAQNLADDDLREELEDAFNKVVRTREYEQRSISAATVEQVQKTRLPFSSLDPKKEEGKEEVSLADKIRQWAPVGFVYALWIAIFSISQMLLNNTIEEKSNRIIEVLLSSVTARELMLGKLFGIAAVGLTMMGTWVLSLVVVLAYQSGTGSETAQQLFHVLKTSGLLPAFAVYFLLGYLMYSGIFIAIGSLCNTIKEAQNLMGPVMLVMIVPLFTMMFIPKDPNGALATIMSWIPLYTPFVMMNRAAADPPLVEVIGTLGLLLATTLLVLWLTGRIFKMGILRTGQPPKLVELLRLLKSPH